jgi:NADPH:quinone reductase
LRAVVVTRHGGPEVLSVEQRPDPDPGPGQLAVAVAYAGVNFRDIYEREGTYGSRPPLVAGMEGSGRVAAVGPGVDGVRVGDRVAWVSALQSYAERVLVDAERAVPIPAGVSDELAAAVLLQGLTAHCLCRDVHPVAAGELVLVHAAAGGVGLLLTQMAGALGATVIGTASTAEKAEIARAAGAAAVFGYDDFENAVLELTGGVPVVYDGVGAATFDGSLACLRPRGLLVVYGWASGVVPPVDLLRLQARSLFLTRASMNHYTATREELLARAADVFAWAADGRLRVRIAGVYPLEQAARAQSELASRRTSGKLLLAVNA